jgi:hypothetical protein
MNDSALRILGGVYTALVYAMLDTNHHIAHDILMGFADNPDIRPEDRRAFRLIALTGGRTDLVEETEQPEQPQSRHRFEVIQGGNNAA